ncbi:MAG: glutamate synthase [Clostridia bacterium]|nr:glutamate synthase [Clostridia bacterium]
MTKLDVTALDHRAINEALCGTEGDCRLTGCCGQRFIAAGMGGKRIEIDGVPGNALGAYLNGAEIVVNGNAQDAVGDTMNDGRIVVRGDIGDAAGYAMRGGEIYVRGFAGYRAGIHMKEYQEKVPVMVIGGAAGSFLGEYQAGGVIVVLGLNTGGSPIVGDFPCTGMYGGRLFLRGDCRALRFPPQVRVRLAGAEDRAALTPFVQRYCALFGGDAQALLADPFTVVTPDGQNPYKQLYVSN